MDRSLNILAKSIHRVANKRAPMVPATPLFGTVVSVQTGSGPTTISLEIGKTGSIIVGVGILGNGSGWTPSPGEQVYYNSIRNVPLALGPAGNPA
jgi:hypothetical protein